MKKAVWLVIFLLGSVHGAAEDAIHLNWRTDYASALQEAAQTRRPLLLDFTGSDWCVWCDRLRDEVFQTRFFSQYAGSSLILVEVDFPRGKPLPKEQQRQNNTLAEKFSITGYPTIVLLAPDGTKLGQFGYMQGGPKTFVRELKRLIATVPAPTPAALGK